MCHLTGKSEPVAPSEDECKAVVGEPAPDFELESDLGGKARLSRSSRQKSRSLFLPEGQYLRRTMQAVNFQAALDKFEKAGYVVIGVSRDSIKSHTNFRNKQGLKFPLLSDADSEVSKLYGVLKLKSMYGRKYLGIVRSTFVIDENGILTAEFRDVKAKTSVADLEKALGIS